MKLTGEQKVALGAYAAAAALSTLAGVLALRLWQADLRVPFDYGGDALLFSLIVKTVVDHGWCWTNPNVGAPAGLQMHDYAVSAHDSFHLLLIKIASFFSGDWALIFNAYFLLGFPLIALSAMAVFRRFRVGYLPAIVGGVLYAFLPSRILKGEGHLFLDVFFQVPLAVLMMLWVCGDDPPVIRDRAPRALWPQFDLRSVRSLAAVLICGLIASTSAYYAFFTVCLLLAGGALASVERRSMRNLIASVMLVGVIAAGMGLNGLPRMLYQSRHGPNTEVGERQTWEAEVYGMKLAPLLLPVPGHRLAAFAQIQRKYERTAPSNGENGITALGIVGGLGFLLLLGVALSTRRAPPSPDDLQPQPLRALAVLTMLAVLLGTLGGFGSLIAFFISPQIRTYSRLNVFIGFFSLFAVVLLVDRLRQRRPTLATLAALGVLAVGLLDQGSLYAIRAYAHTKRQYASDDALVRSIERALPAGAAVFQLPFSPFPEPPPLHATSGYDPIRPYLHSRSLRWSSPTMRGRGSDAWMRDVSERKPEAMLERVSDREFGGILINRNGYADRAAAIEGALRQLLGEDPLVSTAGDLSFYSLLAYNRQRHSGESLADSANRQDRASHPVSVTWGKGFWGPERDRNRTFRWARAESELRFENLSAQVRRVSFSMTLAADRPPAHLRIRGDLLSEDLELVEGGSRLVRTVDVSPGQHQLRFSCDGARSNAPDPRALVWRAESFVYDESPTAVPPGPAP